MTTPVIDYICERCARPNPARVYPPTLEGTCTCGPTFRPKIPCSCKACATVGMRLTAPIAARPAVRAAA